MNGNATRLFRLGVSLAGLVTLGWVLTGQAARPVKHGNSLATDWTHSHLIFSHPRTAAQGAKLTDDPRYWQQIQRRAQQLLLPARPIVRQPIARDPGPKKFKRDWSENLGMGAKAGPGVYPAKFSFDITTANCGDSDTPDFVAFGTGVAGGVSQPSIAAFDNLYSGCSPGTVPNVYWAYNTLGTISTSPVLSLDGTQLAFMQTIAGQAELVVLKWAAGSETLTTPVAPTPVLPAAYQACPAPCMTELPLQTLAPPVDDTTSSVYYDYTNDVAWVGDSKGHLHKFTGVFHATPTEITAGFPKLVSSAALSSPVYDRVTNSVFVSDTAGFLYRVQALSGTTVQSGQMEFSAQTILPPPIVDAVAKQVYFFSADDGSVSCTGGAGCSAVYQLQTNFAADATGTEAVIGDATVGVLPPPNPIFAGAFDNAYLNSDAGNGNMYVCGNTSSNPTLYQVPIQNSLLLGTSVAVSVLAVPGQTPRCSPVTDVSIPGATVIDPPAEKVFLSVQHHSSLVATCTLPTGGCVQSFVDTPWQPSTNYSLGQEVLVQGTNPSHRRLLTVVTPGVSGPAPPTWTGAFGTTITEGTVTWMYQGNPALIIHPWLIANSYTTTTRILDSNGNVQIVTSPGTSGASEPINWSTTAGGTTTGDGSDGLVWTNAGAWPLLGLTETEGTSAIIIDNTVDPVTLLGASQVYFTTLGDQNCGASGTGGCAVQASQSGLQ